jgi:ferric-dicitrate binding protein FerR (iron transport regulator)
VTQASRKAYDEWKDADAAARVAEEQLAKAWEEYFSRHTGAPSHTLIREVSLRRAVANERLSHAMSAISVSRNSGDTTAPGTHPGIAPEKGPRTTEAG